MYLEDQIVLITNPQEFTRLCNSIFTCIYGEDFQIIDGTQSDEGNDGYVCSEKRIFAIYCPIKPEKRTDTDYFGKIKSDMHKAASLRDQGKFKIEQWTFITPRKLSTDLIAKMYKLGVDHGLIANHLESTYLANELYKNPHLLEAFPQLHISRIDSKLDEILTYIKQSQKDVLATDVPTFSTTFAESSADEDSTDNKRVIELRTNIPTDNTKKELKTIYYKTQDDVAKLNALIGVVELFDLLGDDPSDMIELCKSGVTLSEKIRSDRFKAYFLAQKASFLSVIYINEDMKMYFFIMSSNLIGISFVTEAQRQTTLSRLRHLQEEYNSNFNAALELTTNPKDILMLASVLLLIGNAAGQRGLSYRNMGVSGRYQYEKTLCKRSLLLAKDIYSEIRDEEGIANALHNLANQIRFFDEQDEALALTKESIELAKKINNKILLQKAIWLEETIRTGVIPDYVHGEKRKLTE
jgi:hypothetical protein